MAAQDSWRQIPDAPAVAQSTAQRGDSWSDAARLAAMGGQEQAPQGAAQSPQGPPPQPSPSPAPAGPTPSSVLPSPGTSATPAPPVSTAPWVVLEDQSTPSGRLTRRTTTEWMLLPSGVGVLYRTTVQDADAGGAISTSTAQTFVPSPAPAGGVLERIATLLDRITVLAEQQERRDREREAAEQATAPAEQAAAPEAPEAKAAARKRTRGP